MSRKGKRNKKTNQNNDFAYDGSVAPTNGLEHKTLFQLSSDELKKEVWHSVAIKDGVINDRKKSWKMEMLLMKRWMGS